MGFLRRLLGGGAEADRGAPEAEADARATGLLTAREATFDAHADRERVTVWLRLASATFEDEREQQRVFALEDRIMRRLDEAGAGEHDTNSLETGYLAIRLIGDDADAIVAAVQPLLVDAPAGSYLAVRHGPANSGEERLEVGRGRPEG